jgi:hypothetical protein
MSDRCTVTMIYQAKDADKIGEALGENAILSRGKRWCEDVFPDARYGYYCERERLSEDGIVFMGSHTSGHEYDSCLFAAINGRMHEVRAGASDGCFLAVVVPDPAARTGWVADEQSLKEVNNYIEAVKKIQGMAEYDSAIPWHSHL